MVDNRVKINNSGRFLNKKKKKHRSPLFTTLYIFIHIEENTVSTLVDS